MLNRIFPYKLQLNILQLEEYKVDRFLNWIFSNFLTRTLANKKSLVWTAKAKAVMALTLIYVLLDFVLSTYFFGHWGLILVAIASTQSYIYISLAALTLKPLESLVRTTTKNRARTKILKLKSRGLKVIGITGSYGKSSVKEFLYQLLRTKYRVLRTPESYNTVLGITKVIEYELDKNYDFFICEMGAYTIGEIKEICDVVLPDHSILTGINEQHLERFGKIENTIKAKFELAENTAKEGFVLVNGDNELIMQNYKTYRPDAHLYGKQSDLFFIENIETTAQGTKFTLSSQGKETNFETSLIGNANIENILAAISMATLLGVENEKLSSAVRNLLAMEHRLEIRTLSTGLTIIDDAYSSNVKGFREAIDLLAKFTDKQKIIATPGIVELGDKNDEIHKDLGAYMEKFCDKIILVGDTHRTKALYNGIENKSKVIFIKAITEVLPHIPNPSESLLLIENDLPDNY